MSAIQPAAAMVFWGIITFSLLVVLHEGGHFLAARLFGVKVHEFMVGLPGPAIRLKTKSTTYGVTAIPLGGYVRIAGMEPGAEDPLLGRALMTATIARRITAGDLAARLDLDPEHAERLLASLSDWGAVTPAEDDDVSYDAAYELREGEDETALLDRARSVTYRGRSTWQRIVMLSAGVVVNLLAAILTFTVVLSVWGVPMPTLRLDAVQKDSPAAAAGLAAGDRLVSFDGEKLDDWQELLQLIADREPGDRVDVAYVRDGQPRTAEVVLADNQGRPRLGVQSGLGRRYYSVPEALANSLTWTGMVFVAIGDFFRPSTFARSLEGARSVIGISEEVARAAKSGPLDYAWLVALLSLTLGVMNILPIPPLDGGKILMEIIERLLGRPIKREVYLAISATGAILLFTLIAYLMYADVVRIVTRG